MPAEQRPMSKQEILDRERRWARPVAIAVVASVALFVTSQVVGSGLPTDPDETGRVLTEFQDASGSQLIAAILGTIAVVLVSYPLFYLFQAAAARSERMRAALIGVTVAGPLFVGASLIAGWIAIDGAASEFVMGGGDASASADKRADDLITDQAAAGASAGLQFAGGLGILVAVPYTALHAMRVGLLTRFWGVLGIVLGAAIILFINRPSVWAFLFSLALGFMLGIWMRERPPAWAAAEAIPWPKAAQARNEPPPAEEPGLPEGFGEDPDTADEQAVDEHSVAPRKRKRRR